MQYTIHRNKLQLFLRVIRGKIINVKWYKKDGTLRSANVRSGVYKLLKGGKSSANQYNSYVTVYLMWQMDGTSFKAESGYRNLNLSTISSLTFQGTTYEITPQPIFNSIDLSETTAPVPDNLLQIAV